MDQIIIIFIPINIWIYSCSRWLNQNGYPMKALTTMQAAYWVGRQSVSPLGGMAAHL